MLKQHRELLGENFVFDGGMLFLDRDIGHRQLPAADHDGRPYVIHIQATLALAAGGGAGAAPPLQIYNNIFRKILRLLQLKQIGRHYFDPAHPIEIPQHHVQLWPGYFTAISPTHGGIVLVADVAHRILRTGTQLQQLSLVL
jgi:aubergine